MLFPAQNRPRRHLRLSACFLAGLAATIILALWMAPHMTENTLAQSPNAAAQLPGASLPGVRLPGVQLPGADARVRAADFPADFNWLNTDQPLSFGKQLRGRVVVLDFWTYCCINCMHILPDLSYLEHKYADQPVTIIGVHSAKFDNEQDPAQIAQAVRRYRIRHPVIVDQGMELWSQFGVHAWPTFVIIDTTGRVVGQTSGEGQRQLLDRAIQQLLDEGRKNGTLAHGAATPGTPPGGATSVAPAPESQPNVNPQPNFRGRGLSFPGKIITDQHRLFIADSDHDRIVIADLDGKVRQIIGSGQPGFADGPSDHAQFLNPQGMSLSSDGQTLCIADTDNHAIRQVDLKSLTVTTLAGDGTQGNDRTGGNVGRQQPLSSPWDVVLDEPRHRLVIAMAGLHQIWTLDLKTGITRAWIGTGRENIDDGPADEAALAQTSGLTIQGDNLYFADSETSSIRRADLTTGQVTTLAGTGLFDFGLRDGSLKHALLQHPLGITSAGDLVYIADTYNHAMRVIDPRKKIITTLIPASSDGKSPLNEPAGLCIVGDQIYIADTNHHRIIRYDIATKNLHPINLVFTQP
ncbi:MAG: thioredoxin-like domain-containing protein [Phycisphaeraceae bacterium]